MEVQGSLAGDVERTSYPLQSQGTAVTIAVRDAPLRDVKGLWKARGFAKLIITRSIRGEIPILTKSQSRPQTSTLAQSAMKILDHGDKAGSIAVRNVRHYLKGMGIAYLPSISSAFPVELPSSETDSLPRDLNPIGHDATLA